MLRLTFGVTMESILPAREEMERSLGLGVEVPITRYEGIARMWTKRMQPKPSVASEDAMTLFSDNVR